MLYTSLSMIGLKKQYNKLSVLAVMSITEHRGKLSKDGIIQKFKKCRTTPQRRTHHNGNGVDPQEDIASLNVYAPNNRAPKFVKQKLTGFKEKWTIQQK